MKETQPIFHPRGNQSKTEYFFLEDSSPFSVKPPSFWFEGGEMLLTHTSLLYWSLKAIFLQSFFSVAKMKGGKGNKKIKLRIQQQGIQTWSCKIEYILAFLQSVDKFQTEHK